MPQESFFSPCPRGLESLLASELAALGAQAVETVDGGAGYCGEFALCRRVNLHSRIASRVLWRIARAAYRSEEDIYRLARALPWNEWLTPDLTIKVNVSATRCPLKSLDFVTLRIKDAVCDALREQSGARPSVDTQNPDVRIHAYLDARTCALYLDTSGEPLFKRGLRQSAGAAPLRENLAAGILGLAGWQPGIPLLDPMCGSGAFLLEAAQMALGIAPGLGRAFAFEKLKNFDAPDWRALRETARAGQKPVAALPIYGSDLYGEALKSARANLEAAGLGEAVHLKQANALEISAPAPEGILVANPPYGVRLGEQEELARFYPQFGDTLKRKFAGWRAYIFSADTRLPKLIRLAVSRRIPLYNGALECRLYEYKIVAGGMRREK